MHTTLPRRFYADPDFYRTELERFYFTRWICAGRTDQIRRPGDYFTRAVADDSIIVTRDTSGAIHALFNVCRHRGTRICEQPAGHFADRIQCPYHAWTYDLEGRLLAAPHMPSSFCRDEYPLHRAAARCGTDTSSCFSGEIGRMGGRGRMGRIVDQDGCPRCAINFSTCPTASPRTAWAICAWPGGSGTTSKRTGS